MKKLGSFFVFFLCALNNVSSQGVLSVFRNDNQIKEFLMEDIDSIVYRNKDRNTFTYDTQVVYTKYGTFETPLNLVDSVSLQHPLANTYVLNSDDLEDWDEGYVYQSTLNDKMSVACCVKQVGDEILMYLNRLNSLNNVDEGYIFVMGNDGKIKNFLHNGIYFFLTYDNNDISIQGVDSLGNDVFNYTIYQKTIAPTFKKGQKLICLDRIINNYKTFSKIFRGIEMTDMAVSGAWKEFFYSLFKTGIDMSNNLRISIPIKVLEIAYKIISYDMKNQLYRSCKVNVDNVFKKSSNSANVTLSISNASDLSYVYYETETHYNYLHTEYEDPHTYTTVPHTIDQYYSGIVVKKNNPRVSYGDYDIRLPLQTINKTTSTTSFNLSGLEVGAKYYIKPYIIADMLLSDDDFWNFLDGGILYGPVYEYVFNGISVNFNQTSCIYLGMNNMEVTFNLSAEISSLTDVQAWGVVIKDKNGKEIGIYYAESGSSILNIDEQMIIEKSLFNSDNVAEIKLCPFYIYGYYATPIYDETSKYELIWNLNVVTDKISESTITENSANISGSSDGFVVTSTNNIQVGFCYSDNITQPVFGNSINIQGNVDGGFSSGTPGRTFFSSTLGNLEPNTTYYYRAYSKIDGQIYYSDNVESFTTKEGDNLCPDGNHPHMIDLGLPSGTKWACCNVGGYYMWGEIVEKYTENWITYSYCSTNSNGSPESCENLGDIAGTKYDVARVSWGAPWKMPNSAQLSELSGCSSIWTTRGGHNGRLFTGPNGNKIFMPALGYEWSNSQNDYIGKYGLYWSSSQSSGFCATNLDLGEIKIYINNMYRWHALCIRPVAE